MGNGNRFYHLGDRERCDEIDIVNKGGGRSLAYE